MKSAEHRDAVTAKVKEAFAANATFLGLPEVVSEPENATFEVADIVLEGAYVKALFEGFNRFPTLNLRGREGKRIVLG